MSVNQIKYLLFWKPCSALTIATGGDDVIVLY